MLDKLPAIALAVLLLPAPLAAQEPAAQRPGAEAVPPARPAPSLVNVRIDLTIADQRGDTAATLKTITMLIEDRQNARIRTGRGNTVLNVDGHPEILREGRIRVILSLEYTPQDGPDRAAPTPIQESITALVEDGKPLVVSQSADPSSDRRVRLELKATIVK
jgi:hypothetical protein